VTAHVHAHHDHDEHEHEHRVEIPRDVAVRRAVVLNRLSLSYNVIEAVIALGAGLAAGSVSLIGFGLDSVIEVSASLVLLWRLAAERREGCTQESDRHATKAIALCFAALAAYVGIDGVHRLAVGDRPDPSVVGIVLTAASLAIMPVLAREKRRLAPALGSRAQEAEASQTQLCAYLSAVVLVGLLANQALDWWWADPLAALGIAVLAGLEAVRTWRADSLEDTCCA
jgi:divalent metal cation (Fe/Co/Zn/Cd) transporter